MSSEWKWPKDDEKGLARFVLDNATEWLSEPRLPVNWNDFHGSSDNRKALVQRLYETLEEYKIDYTPEKYHPDKDEQLVRTPDEILFSPRRDLPRPRPAVLWALRGLRPDPGAGPHARACLRDGLPDSPPQGLE